MNDNIFYLQTLAILVFGFYIGWVADYWYDFIFLMIGYTFGYYVARYFIIKWRARKK